MRMWMIDPKLLCRKHLLGEHGEIHKHRHNFEKKHKMTGRIFPVVLIEPSSMKIRHDVLAEEMIRRGYNHKSPYVQPSIEYFPEKEKLAKVDISVSFQELINRCLECKERINEPIFSKNY